MIEGIGNYGADSRTYLPTVRSRCIELAARGNRLQPLFKVARVLSSGIGTASLSAANSASSFSQFRRAEGTENGPFPRGPRTAPLPIGPECRFFKKRSICVSRRLNFIRGRHTASYFILRRAGTLFDISSTLPVEEISKVLNFLFPFDRYAKTIVERGNCFFGPIRFFPLLDYISTPCPLGGFSSRVTQRIVMQGA